MYRHHMEGPPCRLQPHSQVLDCFRCRERYRQIQSTAFPGAVRCQKPSAKGFYTKEIKDRIVGAHWCPSDIVKVVDKFESIQMLHFFSRMKKPLGKVHHGDCTANRCVAHSNSLSEYKTRHTEDCADIDHCEDVSMDKKPILDILQPGALPLLQISRKYDNLRKISVQL